MRFNYGVYPKFHWFFGVDVQVDYARRVTFSFARWWAGVTW